MKDELKIDDDIYQFIDNVDLNKNSVKDIIEYVHYKSLLNLFTLLIEENKVNLDHLLSDYIETISNIKLLIEKIKNIRQV